MRALHELQREALDAILDAGPTGPVNLFRTAEPGLAVYRNNARETVLKTLVLTYPVVARLVGEQCFAGLAHQYARQHPSTSGNLDDYGHEFAATIESLYGTTEYAYLSDVARFEWLRVGLLTTRRATPVAASVLAGFDVARYPFLRLRLQPVMRLFTSRYPVCRIWEANQAHQTRPPVIDLASGPDRLLVFSRNFAVDQRQVSVGEFAWLAALARRLTVGQALDAALGVETNFQLDAALGRLFALGLVTEVTDQF